MTGAPSRSRSSGKSSTTNFPTYCVRTLAFFLTQTKENDWCWIDFGVGMVLPLRQDTLGAAAL